MPRGPGMCRDTAAHAGGQRAPAGLCGRRPGNPAAVAPLSARAAARVYGADALYPPGTITADSQWESGPAPLAPTRGTRVKPASTTHSDRGHPGPALARG